MIKSLLVFKVTADLTENPDPIQVIEEGVNLCETLAINVELTIGRVVLVIKPIEFFHEAALEQKRLEDEYISQMGEAKVPRKISEQY